MTALGEVFVVKNTTAGDIEIEDFGLIIPAGVSIDLCCYDGALISEELYGYLASGDLVRVINGEEVPLAQADATPGGITTVESATAPTTHPGEKIFWFDTTNGQAYLIWNRDGTDYMVELG